VSDLVEGTDSEITILLERWRSGEKEARDALIPLVYRRLHQLAAGLLRGERANHTLSPTAVVHEAYMRLQKANVPWQDRGHFLAVASREMRRVLVDHARARQREKRGGDLQRVSFTSVDRVQGEEYDLVRLLDLEAALEKLAAIDPRKTEMVDLVLFGGLTMEEAASQLGVSVATLNRDWRFSRAFLQHEMKEAKT
jgi:RNA polymerase sigma factor (TIGR02999 family)